MSSSQETRLTPAVIGRLLRVVPELLRLELETLPAEVLEYHPAPGEWCVNKVLGHLIEEDPRDFAGRIRAILDGPDAVLPVSDQVAIVRLRHDCNRSVSELLEEFSGQRTASLVLIDSLRPSDLDRAGRHPRMGRIAVSDLLHEWVYHDRNHIQQIHGNVRAFLWPSIGNTGNFYSP